MDLGADVELGVEPGSGDVGGSGDEFEGDGGSGLVEFAQGFDGLGAGELVSATGSGDQVGGVVSWHR